MARRKRRGEADVETAHPAPRIAGERLQALHEAGPLYAPADRRIDRIARLAADHFEVPIAAVRLVGPKRQCFLSKIDDVRLDLAFCAHTMVQDAGTPLVVADAAADFRFQRNPLVVRRPFIRFFAGIGLVPAAGRPLGLLAVADRFPRHAVGPRDRDFLANLGDALTETIEAAHASEEQELLTAELNHRLKNMLSITQAIVRRAAKVTGAPGSYTSFIEGRLSALSVLQSHLADAQAGPARLDLLIAGIATALNVGADRLRCRGTGLALDPNQAQLLSLLLYELLTNAIKHGGLADDAAGVDIDMIATSPPTLRWKERVNRRIAPPGPKGFGTAFIERASAYLGIEVTQLWSPDGLDCTIVFPADRFRFGRYAV